MTGNVLTNDSDADGSTLTATLVTGPANGTLTLNADGSFTYTPDADFNGTDSFTYTAGDGTETSSIATVSITISP
ncbi:Ig-like domain-containing protein, partial [Mycolicibacterium frederiksbergense]|uniref:Ig-like domain-containing protein n=1 Tax=Mycolicibacterium frederiksbergense TaxID=117567 RepID=UPI0039EE2D3D